MAFRVFLNDYSVQNLRREDARALFAAMATKTLKSIGTFLPL
jgi:hypothetical protein